jgi:hypothetical protein
VSFTCINFTVHNHIECGMARKFVLNVLCKAECPLNATERLYQFLLSISTRTALQVCVSLLVFVVAHFCSSRKFRSRSRSRFRSRF